MVDLQVIHIKMATDDDEIVQIPMDENISPEFVQRALSPSFESENTPKTRGRSAKSSKSNSLERGLNSSGPLLPRKFRYEIPVLNKGIQATSP